MASGVGLLLWLKADVPHSWVLLGMELNLCVPMKRTFYVSVLKM